MKRFLKKSLISVLIVVLFFNFLLTPFDVSYAGLIDTIKKGASSILNGGLVGVLTWIPRALLLGVVGGLHTLVSSLAQIGDVQTLDTDGTGDDFFVTPFHIFFNKIELIDVNFFNFEDTGSSPMHTFRVAVAGWYYTMRTIAAMALAVILIYIGIRMAISTIASERAMYKKMLVDWVTSLALLFFLHYIMVFTLMINSALVDAMAAMMKSVGMGNFITNLVDLAIGDASSSVLLSFTAIGVYAIIVFQTLAFLLSYIKRMLNIGFLIIIAPLITITYSVDKIGDGKAQALNVWLKEFIYNILIQPFHCILFLAFAQVAYELLSENLSGDSSSLARAILAVLCVQYIKTGEDIVKQIFGFKQAGSLATMAAGTAMAMTAMNQAGNVAKKAGGAVSGAKRAIAKNPEVRNLTKGIKGLAKEKALDRKATREATKALKKENSNKKVDKKSDAFKREKESKKQEIVSKRAAKAQGKGDGEKADIKGIKKISEGWKNLKSKHPIATSALGIPAGFARDTMKYISSNKGKIASAAVGGVVGFGALGAGDFMSAVTGYKAGSGFVQGYNENSTKTLRNQMRGDAQVIADLTGQGSSDDIIKEKLSLGEAGEFKDLSKKIDALTEKLTKLGVQNARSFVGGLQSSINSPHDKSYNVHDDISDRMSKANGITNENRDEVRGLLEKHAELVAGSNLYNNIQNGLKMGNDMNSLAYIVGDFNPSRTASQVQESSQATQASIDSSDIEALGVALAGAAAISSFSSTSSIDPSKIDELNDAIEELNSAITSYERADDSKKQEILSAINKNDNLLREFNSGNKVDTDSMQAFESNIKTYVGQLQTRRDEIQASLEEAEN